ncbi:MAG: GNAT family N-acetyltransferase [Bacteroidia bacterium]|nr:GNAT family N-acetyltransferase [Bacteroidia bacterium]
MEWKVMPFEDLKTRDLYELLRLRSLVFHKEQNCAYVDTDNKDQDALHVLGYRGNQLIAYARILPAGVSFREVSVGRVVTHPECRGLGAGRELMNNCLKLIADKYGCVPVRIGAQCYLEKFYREFGFVPQGEPYPEDNIPHIEMLR